mmetsp:Transcript_281/g.535  ORF Transcript_281/g.535 Transcript_281/m.535 type:complete len:81 (-) Transcript_281:91-333(-)
MDIGNLADMDMGTSCIWEGLDDYNHHVIDDEALSPTLRDRAKHKSITNFTTILNLITNRATATISTFIKQTMPTASEKTV